MIMFGPCTKKRSFFLKLDFCFYDLEVWMRLTDEERHFVSCVLAFFTASNSIVNENLVKRFSQEVQGLHTDFACLLFKHQKPPQAAITQIICEAVTIEQDFLTNALPVRLIGMICEKMAIFIKFIAIRLLIELGCPIVYRSSNPLPIKELTSQQGKTKLF